MTIELLPLMFAIIGEIILRFLVVGGGIALVIGYIHWAACRFEDNLFYFLVVAAAPFLLFATIYNTLVMHGYIK